MSDFNSRPQILLNLVFVEPRIWPIEGNCGVLWCGEAAAKMTHGRVKTGSRRVTFNSDEPRFTAWYEASIDAQLTKAIVECSE